jgi:hypothetical protein
VKNDVVFKCSHCGADGTNQRLDVELWDGLILCCEVHVAKFGGKVGNMIEDLLKEGIAMPVKKWHVGVSCIIPSCPLCVVDDPDEFHQKLTEDRWRAVSGGYGCDYQIHVDAKAGNINNGYHSANSGNGSLEGSDSVGGKVST